MPVRTPLLAFRLQLLALTLLGASCAGEAPAWLPAPEDFPNGLSLAGAPDSARDLSSHAFSDLGAWHMFGLPDPVADSLPGAFPGPLLLAEGGLWMGRETVAARLRLNGVPVSLAWDPSAPHASAHLPGRLRQDLVAPGLTLGLELVFASSRSTLIRATLVNRGLEELEAELAWGGEGFFLPVRVDAREGEVRVELPDGGTRMRVRVAASPGERPVETKTTGGPAPHYLIRTPSVLLPPGGAATRYALVTVEGGPGSGAGDSSSAGAPPGALVDDPEVRFLADPEAVLDQNRARWSAYLSRVVGRGEPPLVGGSDARAETGPSALDHLAVKAVQTLISNWRSPRGHLLHDGLFPSYAYRGFHGVWSWDSWKHARALALFAPELAKEQIRVMLDHQDAGGMIPDVIYVDSAENNWRDTKPPLAAWATHGIFLATGDTSFVAEVYPALLAYHEWWYRDRDHDGNGLCEYGSTDGTLIAAAWESGMDNAVRFDGAQMVRNGPQAWSMDRESVDLNAYLFADKGYLADLAQVLGRDADAARLGAERDRLGSLVRSTTFDDETGYFYDVHLQSRALVRIQGPEGWIPLWAGLATPEQADRVALVMTDSTRFAGRVPFPTLAMDHPEFDPLQGYWRGPVWLDQAYFAVRGLERYGHLREAGELRARLLEAPRGLLGNAPIHENYHPRTGEGLNAPHFSWSAAHLLLLIAEGR